MKITKENAVAQVQSSISSIFSKEDVINLINSIEVGSSIKITPIDIARAIDKTVDSLERNSQDLLNYTDIEFSISYDNRIEVDNVGLDFDYIREALENNFSDFAEEDYFDSDEKELEEIKRIEEDNQ